MGMTLPLLPNTFPKRTARIPIPFFGRSSKALSASRLLQPIILVGFTALSVEIITKRFTPHASAVFAKQIDPNTLFRIAAEVFNSIKWTCL